jgi:hypothetical protein
MADNYNISLPGAAQGAADVMQLGPSIQQNAARTLEQQQLLAQAQERTKQAQMQTSLEAAGGLEAEKGLVPKQQAVAQVRLALEQRGDMTPDEIEKQVSEFEQASPDIMNAWDLQRYFSVLKEGKQANEAFGTAFSGKLLPATAKDVSGEPINPNAYYTQGTDGSYRLSGEQASEVNATAKSGATDDKTWAKIVTALDVNKASSRSAIGIAARAITLGTRGLALLQQPKMTAQNRQEISRELDSIIRGGVATNAGAAELDYRTLSGAGQEVVQYLTGISTDTLSPDLKQQLTNSFDRVLASSRDLIASEFNYWRSAYPQVTQAHEQELTHMENAATHPPTSEISTMMGNEPTGGPQGLLQHVGEFVSKLGHFVTGPTGAPVSQNLPAAGTLAPAQPAQNDPLGIRTANKV